MNKSSVRFFFFYNMGKIGKSDLYFQFFIITHYHYANKETLHII